MRLPTCAARVILCVPRAVTPFIACTGGGKSNGGKAERLPWTPAEDAEIVRSVQQIGLKCAAARGATVV